MYTLGMSLRKWVKHGFVEANKAERLQIYRQVVEVVDVAHSQGNALQDLCLSNFVLLPSNEIVYFNSSNEHTAQTSRQHEHDQSYSLSEKNWYACPEELGGRDLLSANIYSLGILLFELLWSFVSLEEHSAAISNLHNRILPPDFLSDNPQEAGFCLWLLHPDPSSRPTTREILQSDLFSGTKELYPQSTYSSIIDKNKDAELETLLDFLNSLKEQKEKHALELREYLQFVETDMNSLQHEDASGMLYDSNIMETRMKKTISELESAYISKKRSQLQPAKAVSNERNDLDLLRNHERQDKNVGCIDDFLKDTCNLMRYTKFEVCGILEIGNLLNSANLICSLSFDHDENYIAAGVSKKIKIFDFVSLSNDSADVKYPIVELLNKSKISCACWNKYLKNYLASSDYDGLVQVSYNSKRVYSFVHNVTWLKWHNKWTSLAQVWDAFTGQGLSDYMEHQQRAWCVDFSHADPSQFASGSDESTVKLWSLNNKTSTSTIRSGANVCCVQFSSRSSHMLAFGSADNKIRCYDLRHARIPWCTLADHQKTVSYVKFLDSDSLVSASTDNTLKLWDLKKTSLEGISTDACCMTYKGHTNQMNFVGLSVLDEHISCGSESNEVYAYHKSFPMPITSYKFGSTGPISGADNDARFVSSVCWREKSNMVVAANSGGSIKVLKLV